MAKRRIIPFHELGDAGDFMEHVDTPLSCALIAGAYIENALGSLLSAALIDGETSTNLLNNPKDALSTYAARADLCYCLGMIAKPVYATVRAIGTIRNRFAHSHQAIDFDDPEVSRLCANLVLPPVTDQRGKAVELKDFIKPEDSGGPSDDLHLTKTKFILAVTFSHLALKAASVGASPQTPSVVAIRALTGGHNVEDPSIPAPIIFFTE